MTARTTKPRGLILVCAFVLTMFLLLPGSTAAHHILAAKYTGEVEGGGTVTFYTSEAEYLLLHPDVPLGGDEANHVCQTPDDRCALQFKDVPTCAGNLIASANTSAVYTSDEWYGVHGFESRPYGQGDFDYYGLFASPNGAYGTLTYRFCGSHTVNWQATTDSTNPPWVDPCPNPQCDFGDDPSGGDPSDACGRAKQRVAKLKQKLQSAEGPKKKKLKKKLKKAKVEQEEACG